jgi:hypothetical protein
MKKLILIQNDYPGTGKSTLALCFHRYLQQYGVSHQLLSLTEEDIACPRRLHPARRQHADAEQVLRSCRRLAADDLGSRHRLGRVFQQVLPRQLRWTRSFPRRAMAVSVVLPVTADRESFDSVTEAAEVFSDNAEYLIAHLVTSCYDEDDKVWDTSYAARVMDMFEAVELHIPEITFHLELSTERMSLDSALKAGDAEERLGKEYTKWHRRVMGQVDSARQYLFGDAFRPTIMAPCETSA